MPDQPIRKTTAQSPKKTATRYDTPERITENFQKWWSAMEASHTMLMAGLRDRVGKDGDVQQAYFEWNRQRRARKMRAYEQAAERFRRRQSASGKAIEAPDAT